MNTRNVIVGAIVLAVIAALIFPIHKTAAPSRAATDSQLANLQKIVTLQKQITGLQSKLAETQARLQQAPAPVAPTQVAPAPARVIQSPAAPTTPVSIRMVRPAPDPQELQDRIDGLSRQIRGAEVTIKLAKMDAERNTRDAAQNIVRRAHIQQMEIDIRKLYQRLAVLIAAQQNPGLLSRQP